MKLKKIPHWETIKSARDKYRLYYTLGRDRIRDGDQIELNLGSTSQRTNVVVYVGFHQERDGTDISYESLSCMIDFHGQELEMQLKEGMRARLIMRKSKEGNIVC